MGRQKSYVNAVAAEQLAKSLRRLFGRTDFTYRKLAEITFYDPAFVWRVINGEAIPSWTMTERIVCVCHETLGYPVRYRTWRRRWVAVRVVRL